MEGVFTGSNAQKKEAGVFERRGAPRASGLGRGVEREAHAAQRASRSAPAGTAGAMGGDASKEAIACCDCGFQQRNQILEATEVNGVSSMKLHENNQRFLRAMAEGGKSDLILGLFSTTREFDVNAVDDLGESALHKAAKNGHVIVCHVLIKRGARPDIKNKDGKTAVDVARENNHHECVEYLQEPGLVQFPSTCGAGVRLPMPPWHRDTRSVAPQTFHLPRMLEDVARTTHACGEHGRSVQEIAISWG